MTCFFYLPRVYTKKFIISQNLVQKYATKLTFPSFFNSSSAVMNQRMLKQVGTATSSSAVHDALEVPSGWLLGKGLQTDTQHPPNTHLCNKKNHWHTENEFCMVNGAGYEDRLQKAHLVMKYLHLQLMRYHAAKKTIYTKMKTME